jgi:hypothetical protein
VAHHPDWSKGAGKVADVSENPAVLCTTWRQVSKLRAKEIETQAKVVSYEANRKFGAVVDKPLPGQMVWPVEPHASGAQVAVSGDFDPDGFFGIGAPLLAKAVKDQFNSDLGGLKTKLEAT